MEPEDRTDFGDKWRTKRGVTYQERDKFREACVL